MTEARKQLIEEVAIALSMADPDSRGLPDGVTMAEFYRRLADVAVTLVGERMAKMAELYARAALKCKHCGDTRHTYTPGGCSGEARYRESDEYKSRVALDGSYDAIRYFEKHICQANEMDTREAFEDFAAAIRSLTKGEG